ncbi:MAG: ABC transporter ATP-binding protein [Haloarculaceae archaeon]
MGNQAVVRLTDMTKRYGSIVAVDDLSFEVKAGEFFSLLGPSGCGKSTTLRTIAGFEEASTGTVEIQGTDVTDVPAHERDTGMVFQGYALFPHKTVGENVGFGLKMDGVSREERENRVAEMLETVNLGGYESRMPSELSGGQQQRVALARALIIEPSVLLLDEPLAALDLQLRQRMRIELQRIQDTLDITTIYVTHDQEEALSMSDRILVLDGGQAQQIDSPRTLYNSPQNEFVADFIGEANLLPATVESENGNAASFESNVEGVGSFTISRDRLLTDGLSPGESVLVNVRPEDIRVALDGTDDPNVLTGTITTKTFIGKTTQFHVATGNGREIMAEASGFGAQQAIETGDEVTLSWSEDDCTVIRA